MVVKWHADVTDTADTGKISSITTFTQLFLEIGILIIKQIG